MFQVGRKWQPYRTASRYVPLESTQNQDSWSLIGPSFKWLSVLSSRVDVRRQPAARRLLVARHAVDDRRPQDRPRDQQRPDARRVPRDRSHAAALAVRRAPTPTSRSCGGRNHELKTGYLGWRNIVVDREHRLSEPAAVPLSQPDRRPELRRSAQLRRLLHASRLGAGLRLPEHDRVGRVVQLGLLQRQDHAVAQADAERRRALRPLLELPARAGQPGHRARSRRTNIFAYKGESNYPIYSTLVPRVSAVYDLTGEGRVAVRASYGRYVGGSSGASANPGPGATDVNPNAIITRTYSNWDGTHSVRADRRPT